MATTVSKLPEPIKVPLRRLRYLVGRVIFYGNGRFCPICEHTSRRFLKSGLNSREDAQCPHCRSLERHRLTWLYITTQTNLYDSKPKKMLHVAPELFFIPKFKQLLGDNYLTADLFDPKAMVKMDITNIEYPPESFDVIYCSHVLEHVQDDKKAMREFHRTLKSNGWAILNVPINAEQTFEDPAIVDPDERLKAFGQKDHVRRYGPDYADRLRDVGFRVEVIKVNDLVNNDEAYRMGLASGSDEIFYCTK
ncbi:MAG: class I SAM-dependent methyltransferase [Candidatus Promineifilaceae bacterium]